MSPIELVATVFGLLCVWLYVRENVWSWPTGLVQVCLYIWIFYEARLYSDFLLQIVYVVLQIYGWYEWVRGGEDRSELAVTRISSAGAAWCLAVSVVGTVVLGWTMHRFTNAASPYWDACVTVMSLVAQFLLARKVLENWVVWIAVDVLAIGLYLSKGLYLTGGLYAVFLCMAMMGWLTWRRNYLRMREPVLAGASSSESSCRPTAATSS